MNNRLVTNIGQALVELRQKKPLIHHITNYVTANDCANAVLAIGASPIMADDIGEVKEITSISSALVINIGTLNSRTIESMIIAGKEANERNIPVIFDPVGAGASRLRNQSTERILSEVKINILRGNMSEISFISGSKAETKGVDVSEADLKIGEQNGRLVAEKVAKEFGCVTAITGAIDIISDGSQTYFLCNGTEYLAHVTGTGCMSTSLIGAFCGAVNDPLVAATGGILSMGIAGELAYEESGGKGNGSFRVSIFDALSKLSPETLMGRAKLHEA